MIKAVHGGLPHGLSFCFFKTFSLIKHTNVSLLNNKKEDLMFQRHQGWEAAGLCGLSLPWPPVSRPHWSPADQHDEWGQSVLSSWFFWSVGSRLIQGQTWLPGSLPFGNQPPGVCSNEQAAFSSCILVSPPFESKTLPHLLASGIAIIAWRIIGGNSI